MTPRENSKLGGLKHRAAEEMLLLTFFIISPFPFGSATTLLLHTQRRLSFEIFPPSSSFVLFSTGETHKLISAIIVFGEKNTTALCDFCRTQHIHSLFSSTDDYAQKNSLGVTNEKKSGNVNNNLFQTAAATLLEF